MRGIYSKGTVLSQTVRRACYDGIKWQNVYRKSLGMYLYLKAKELILELSNITHVTMLTTFGQSTIYDN
jgi:hypothetical protein